MPPVKTSNITQLKLPWSLDDNRAFMGGLALLMSGLVTTVMLLQYLNAGPSAGFSRSRLWWEVALNVEVLAAGLMWFCYTDRIEDSGGAIRTLNRVRLWFGMYGVLLPAMIVLAGIWNDWFEIRPDSVSIIVFAIAMYAVWQLGVIIDWAFRRGTYKEQFAVDHDDPSHTGNFRHVLYYLPILSLLFIVALCWMNNDAWWILAVPALVYVQSSVPYFVRAFGFRL